MSLVIKLFVVKSKQKLTAYYDLGSGSVQQFTIHLVIAIGVSHRVIAVCSRVGYLKLKGDRLWI